MIKEIKGNILIGIKKPYVAWPGMILLFISILFLNLIFIHGGKYSVEHIFEVLKHPTISTNSEVYKNWNPGEAKTISESIWALFSTIVGASGLAIAGLITQALTRNPLADASTLGMTQSGIFGLLLALSFGFIAFYLKFIFALIFGIISAVILIFIISFSKSKASSSKIILAGLAIGIIFKTFSFLIRKGDKFLSGVSFNYILGGAESVNTSIGNNQWQILYISSALIGLSLFIFIAISKSLTIIELGENSAKALGVKVRMVKLIALITIILSVPSSILIMGNVAFIGLFSVHLARYFLKTRNYFIICFPAVIFSSLLGMSGLFLTQFAYSINSGLWMTFIGAPYLIYAGLRGLK